jgi:DNA (cytosine-5)-methyltransferase 1
MNEFHKKLGLLFSPHIKKYKQFPTYQESKKPLPPGNLTAIGFTSGIGSMLIGAKQAGFKVVGNIEWRDYYRLKDEEGRNTFIENFPGAFLARGLRDLDPIQLHDLRNQITIAMGHPECGSYSLLNSANKRALEQKHDFGDIPLFLEYVAEIKPRYFVMDDLPQSFIAFPMSEYHRMLPDYDLFPEWISNYNYGNPQRHRKRMFMIGALKTQNYVFVPGERDDWTNWTVLTRIGDIEGKFGEVPNHDPHTTQGYSSRFINMRSRGDRPNWKDVRDYFKKFQKPGANFKYHGEGGVLKVRPSLIRIKYDYPSPVLTGGNPMMHPELCLPLSIRERARIQGFPDDFVFYGTRLDSKGQWEHNNHNMWMVKQTGKAMPIEFNDYVARQIMAHVKGKKFKTSGKRFLKPDPFISRAKQWFCEKVGYADQENACRNCWLYDICQLPRKVGDVIPLDLEGLLR